MMRILFCGDIVGKAGRKVVCDNLPMLKQAHSLDFIIVNGENAAHGFGLTEKICHELFMAGIDVITTGNHVWDKVEMLSYIVREPRVLRPLNYPDGTPGKGLNVFTSDSGHTVMVANTMGRLFMEPMESPLHSLMPHMPNGMPADLHMDAIIVDMHAEASSEKYALGHFLDGHVSLVVGTHTHIPTADHHIMVKGTAFQCDAGMCGDYDSVIGMDKNAAMDRFAGHLPRSRLVPAEGVATLCGVVVETDEKTGLAKSIQPLRVGGKLSPIAPSRHS